MINVFNRRELAITRAMSRQARIRQLLEEAGIEYSVKTRNIARDFSHNKAVAAANGGKQRQEYTIYVRKSDFDAALHIIEQ